MHFDWSTPLTAHDVTVMSATFKMRYDHLHNAKQLYSVYLSEIL